MLEHPGVWGRRTYAVSVLERSDANIGCNVVLLIVLRLLRSDLLLSDKLRAQITALMKEKKGPARPIGDENGKIV